MSDHNETTTFFQMKDSTYDFLSGLVKYVLPGLATLYLSIAMLLGLPYGEVVAGIITAVTTFLGGLLGVSKRSYLALQSEPIDEYDGDLLVDLREEGSDLLTVALDRDIDEVRNLDTVKFRVIRSSETQK